MLTADSSLEDVPAPDVIVIPGSGKVPFLDDPAAVEWVRAAHERSQTGIAVGFLMVVPAALIALFVLLRHPEVAR